jgi:hypothetical protein
MNKIIDADMRSCQNIRYLSGDHMTHLGCQRNGTPRNLVTGPMAGRLVTEVLMTGYTILRRTQRSTGVQWTGLRYKTIVSSEIDDDFLAWKQYLLETNFAHEPGGTVICQTQNLQLRGQAQRLGPHSCSGLGIPTSIPRKTLYTSAHLSPKGRWGPEADMLFSCLSMSSPTRDVLCSTQALGATMS